MRDMTLYEDEQGRLSTHPPVAGRWYEVPAVVGKTVAEIEKLRAQLDKTLQSARDEARAGADILAEAEHERDKARAEAEKLREQRDTLDMSAHMAKEIADFAIRQRDEARVKADKAHAAFDSSIGFWKDKAAKLASDVKLMMPAVEKSERYREALDDAIELAASAVRAHTRAIHHLAGRCDYPAAEQGATGEWLADALRGCRDTREALNGSDDPKGDS